MGLCAVLLICLSQAELSRVWAQEHEGKPPFFNASTNFNIQTHQQHCHDDHSSQQGLHKRTSKTSKLKHYLWSLTKAATGLLKIFVCTFYGACIHTVHACVTLTGLLTFLTISHRKLIKNGVLLCPSRTCISTFRTKMNQKQMSGAHWLHYCSSSEREFCIFANTCLRSPRYFNSDLKIHCQSKRRKSVSET